MTTLKLTPTYYSKAKTCEQVMKKLELAPKQLCNSPEAYKGNVMEFVVAGTSGPVGTLSEYEQFNKADRYFLQCTNGSFNVARTEHGDFKVVA